MVVLSALFLTADAKPEATFEPRPEPSGSLIVTADYEKQVLGEVLPFDGSFVAGNGLTVDFTSQVTYTEHGWSAEAFVQYGGKQFLVTHELDLFGEDGGKLRFADLTPDLQVEPVYGLALGDLALELTARFPEPPRTEAAFGPEPLGRGIRADTIGVNKALLRETARLVGRWTITGLLDRDDGEGGRGFERDCDAFGKCTGGRLPPPPPTPSPTPTCAAQPTDTLTEIDCANRCIDDGYLYNGDAPRHLAEHDLVAPALLPHGQHCVVTQNEVCGRTQVTFAAQSYGYCTGRCGIMSTSSPFPTCQATLHGRTSWQDCLDADSCIVRHELGSSGVGSQGCSTMEAQAIDDEVAAFARDLPFYAISVFVDPVLASILVGFLADLSFEVIEECNLTDPLKNTDPVTVEGTSCVCPVKEGSPTPFCTSLNQCIYPNVIPGFCTHSPCDGKIGYGSPLAEGCDTGIPGDPGSVVSQVCATDPYCCMTYWDGTCREQAMDVGLVCP